MNLLYLQYAVEIEKTGSINKAAENLYMGQPNLSRAIKELEASLGISIFARSSKGMVPTPQGEEFLHYAKKILGEVGYRQTYLVSELVNKIKTNPDAEPIATTLYSYTYDANNNIKHISYEGATTAVQLFGW